VNVVVDSGSTEVVVVKTVDTTVAVLILRTEEQYGVAAGSALSTDTIFCKL
jgi:hypothetical protein